MEIMILLVFFSGRWTQSQSGLNMRYNPIAKTHQHCIIKYFCIYRKTLPQQYSTHLHIFSLKKKA